MHRKRAFRKPRPFAFNLGHRQKAKRMQRSGIALHVAKIRDSGFSRNALGQGGAMGTAPHHFNQNNFNKRNSIV